MARAPGLTCVVLEEVRDTYIKFSVDLLPEVNVPWVCSREGATVSALQRAFHDTIDDLLRLGTVHPRMPPVHRFSAQWTVLRDSVVLRECFATVAGRGPEVEASGYTIRVPLARMLTILARISGLLGEIARRQGAEEPAAAQIAPAGLQREPGGPAPN